MREEAGRIASRRCSTAVQPSAWQLVRLPGCHSDQSTADTICKTSRCSPVVLALHGQEAQTSQQAHSVHCMPVGGMSNGRAEGMTCTEGLLDFALTFCCRTRTSLPAVGITMCVPAPQGLAVCIEELSCREQKAAHESELDYSVAAYLYIITFLCRGPQTAPVSRI